MKGVTKRRTLLPSMDSRVSGRGDDPVSYTCGGVWTVYKFSKRES